MKGKKKKKGSRDRDGLVEVRFLRPWRRKERGETQRLTAGVAESLVDVGWAEYA